MDFNKLRNSIIDEAKASPNLLSDLAGLEHYISETYDSRSFVELIQNAEDASSKRIKIKELNESLLIVSNDGADFTIEDLNSLCRSAASNKKRGSSIGYRGIGFKSVVNLCKNVHLISGDFEVTFSRELSLESVPAAKNVPLIRIPHCIDQNIKNEIFSYISHLKDDGMTTFFIFEGIENRNISNELSDLDSSSLMFLSSLREVEIETSINKKIHVQRDHATGFQRVSLYTNNQCSEYFSYGVGEDFNIAVRVSERGEAIKMNSKESVVHSFLPSFEETGINAKIQGDISTDPSRTRVVLDDKTSNVVKLVSGFIAKEIKYIFSDEPLFDKDISKQNFIKAVIPTRDPRSSVFQKSSFMTEFYSELHLSSEGEFDFYRLRPKWINGEDYFHIMKCSSLSHISESILSLDRSEFLFKVLGIKESNIEEILSDLGNNKLSILGCSELLSKLTILNSIGQLNINSLDENFCIWPTKGEVLSYNQFDPSIHVLDSSFIDLVIEKVGSRKKISLFLNKLYGHDNKVKDLFLDLSGENISVSNSKEKPEIIKENLSPHFSEVSAKDFSYDKKMITKKWRSAEEVFCNVFERQGWEVKDVSKQNIGYDFHCIDTKDGSELFVEVKNIKNELDGFQLTSNEEAVAREKGDRYVLAFVRESKDKFEISLLYEPLNKIKLTRQCRQWVWYCEEYPYDPVSYPKLS